MVQKHEKLAIPLLWQGFGFLPLTCIKNSCAPPYSIEIRQHRFQPCLKNSLTKEKTTKNMEVNMMRTFTNIPYLHQLPFLSQPQRRLCSLGNFKVSGLCFVEQITININVCAQCGWAQTCGNNNQPPEFILLFHPQNPFPYLGNELEKPQLSLLTISTDQVIWNRLDLDIVIS